VITGGATMAREAAFHGTLGISLFPGKLVINEVVEEMGFPLKNHVSPSEAYELALKSLKEKTLYDVEKLLAELERPNEVVVKEVEALIA